MPIDGIGLQMHIDYETDLDAMDRCMRVLGRLREIDPDFVLEVTELDMSCFTWNDTSTQRELTEEFVQQFDEKYCQVFSLLMDYAQEGLLDTVVFWGYDDGSSWLNEYPVEGRTNHPLLIDRELKFKSAYWALMNLPQQRAARPPKRSERVYAIQRGAAFPFVEGRAVFAWGSLSAQIKSLLRNHCICPPNILYLLGQNQAREVSPAPGL